MHTVSKIKVKGDIKTAVIEAVKMLGGMQIFIKKNDKVLLKPNFNTADIFPGSSDIEFLKIIIELMYEAKAGEVILGDSSTFMLNSETVMKKKEIYILQEIFPKLKILNFDKGKWVKKNIPNGKCLKTVRIPEIVEKVDKIIFLPCLKTHFATQFTGSIKLSVGFMKPIERLGLHTRNLQKKVGELASVFKPNLIIMDGRKCFISGGPGTGDVRNPDFILASTSRIDLDIEGIKIIQSFDGNSLVDIIPEQLPQIKRAIEMDVK